MQRIAGAFMSFALLCLPSVSGMAADSDNGNSDVPRHFTLYASDPGGSNQTVKSSPSTTSQSPRSMPRAVQPAPMSGREKFRHYLRTTYGPGSTAYTVFSAGLSQANGSVYEWGGGMEGYGKRFASALGQKAVSRSIWQGLGALAHEDPRYFPSNRSGLWSRSFYAASQSFISHKDSGGTRPGYTKMIGAFGGGAITRQWYPDRYHTAGEYFKTGGISIGYNMLRNVFSEFWPDIRRMLHH